MRSKEVEEAMTQLLTDMNFTLVGNTTAIVNVNNIETLLDYILELEELPNKIRDKIKEIEYSCMLLLNNYEKCDTCEKENCSKRGKYLILKDLLEGE